MKHPSRRFPFTVARMAQVAYLAGKGCSAPEIGAALGMKPGTVYWLLFENKIPLTPKSGSEIAFPVVMPKRAIEDLKTLARDVGAAPDDLLGRLIAAVLAERTVAMNLLEMEIAE